MLRVHILHWCRSGIASIESDDAEEVKFVDSSFIDQSGLRFVRTSMLQLCGQQTSTLSPSHTTHHGLQTRSVGPQRQCASSAQFR